MLRPFTLHRPATAEEACALLERHGDEAAVYAGGTGLLLLMKLGVLRARKRVARSLWGSAKARLPPTVPTLRTRTLATCRATAASTGQLVSPRGVRRVPAEYA